MSGGHSMFRALAMKKAAELAARQAEAKVNEDRSNNGP
jgi:hypothetical protein